jgi:hypothetical protein
MGGGGGATCEPVAHDARFARTTLATTRFPACSYVAGEFVGGCDITTQMHQSGELGKLLEEKVKKAAA